MTGAQIFDWLEDKLGVTSVAETTVRNYVKELREVYHIPKQIEERDFSTVPELL